MVQIRSIRNFLVMCLETDEPLCSTQPSEPAHVSVIGLLTEPDCNMALVLPYIPSALMLHFFHIIQVIGSQTVVFTPLMVLKHQPRN